MVCCLAVGCVVGDLKVQVFKVPLDDPPPSVIVLFCHPPPSRVQLHHYLMQSVTVKLDRE